MTQMVMAICGEPYDKGFHIRRYAYLGDAMENEKPRDTRYINSLIDRLNIHNEGEDVYQSWTANEKPPSDYVRLFDVYLYIENVGKPNAVYKADYHAYPHCPSLVIEDGMGIYRAIRKEGIRPSIKKQEEMNRIRESKRKEFRVKNNAATEDSTSNEVVRFEEGRMYFYPKKDALGHIEMGVIKVIGVLKEAKKIVIDIACGRKRVVVDIQEIGNCESVVLRKEGVTVSSQCLVKEEAA